MPFSFRPKVTLSYPVDDITRHGGHMSDVCEICCIYGIWLRVPGLRQHGSRGWFGSCRGQLEAKKHIAENQEREKQRAENQRHARKIILDTPAYKKTRSSIQSTQPFRAEAGYPIPLPTIEAKAKLINSSGMLKMILSLVASLS